MLCDYFGNPWIGVFIKTNNKVTLVPKDALTKLREKIRSILKTELIPTSISGTNLLGLYTVMNSNGIVVPNVIEQSEVKILKKHGLNVYISQEKFNAHGNNVVVNDKIGFVNKNISVRERKRIEDTLAVELIPTTIAGYSTVGSACVLTNRGFLVHYNTPQSELERLSSLLNIPGERGTINMGVGFIALGLVANDRGCLAGLETSAFELGRVQSALGLL